MKKKQSKTRGNIKMKRIIYLIVAGLLCIQLVGCASNPIEKETNQKTDINIKNDVEETDADSESPQKQVTTDAYDAIIQKYETAVKEGWDAARMMENEMNYMIPGCLEQDERANVGYFKGDLNGDGQPELAIAATSESEYYTGMIFVLYELEDGQPTILVESGERDRWYYAADGKLYNEASNSAAESSYSLCTADRDLAYLDAVEYNAVQYPDDPWLRFTGETWEHISEKDANTAMLEIRNNVKNLEITPFQ